MAEQNANGNVENLVRRILSSVQDVSRETSPRSVPDVRSRRVAVNNTVDEEVNRRFNIPRGDYTSRSSSTGSSNTTLNATSGIHTARSVAQQYNPSQNYGYTNYNTNNARWVNFTYFTLINI